MAGFNISDNLIVKNGSIGIGISDPNADLHVVGNAFFSSSVEEVVRVNTTGNSAAIHWRESDAIRGLMGFSNGSSIYTGADADDMVIRSEAKLHIVSNASSHGITINSGNVGIGTTSPSEKLHVSGNIKTTGVITSEGSSASSFYALQLSRSGSGTTTPDIWGTNNTLVIGTSSSVESVSFSGANSTFYGDATVNGNLYLSDQMRIGDDAWIEDFNVANSIRIKGNQSSSQGYIAFGNRSEKLGQNNSGTLTFNGNTVWHAGNDGSGSGLDADSVDGYQGADLLKKDNSANWTRLGYGTSGTAYWHKLVEVTINGSYKDYLVRVDWTSRYYYGQLSIHVHSDNDTTADVWNANVINFGLPPNRKNISDFKYYKSGSTVQVWVYTPGWREFDYIRRDAVTEGTPTITWYKEGDSGVGKTTTQPSGLTTFTDHSFYSPASTPASTLNIYNSSGTVVKTVNGI